MDIKNDPHKNAQIWNQGKSIDEADAVIIMMHGRGASAKDILLLSNEFNNDSISYMAPQANDFTWYPNSFLFPIESNEPYLTSALKLLARIMDDLVKKGIGYDKIYLLGFSQGACLTLEFAARNPKKYRGIFGLSGGLIGPSIVKEKYSGSLEGCKVFLGCSDIDPHVPQIRVDESEKIFQSLNANVEKRIYKNMGHTVNRDEIDFIKNILNKKSG